ncbi:hypothetical protein Cadr_000010838 [Camelus dromedarius]|uniref:Uncharacterized protein n=1 Tax=Camelus dromedarius TaxID=9838 RepID=A0A5N4DV25_CAMDR|nr:hypothetical protein Cadr_000010838 [Camelus dromedarius]
MFKCPRGGGTYVTQEESMFFQKEGKGLASQPPTSVPLSAGSMPGHSGKGTHLQAALQAHTPSPGIRIIPDSPVTLTFNVWYSRSYRAKVCRAHFLLGKLSGRQRDHWAEMIHTPTSVQALTFPTAIQDKAVHPDSVLGKLRGLGVWVSRLQGPSPWGLLTVGSPCATHHLDQGLHAQSLGGPSSAGHPSSMIHNLHLGSSQATGEVLLTLRKRWGQGLPA